MARRPRLVHDRDRPLAAASELICAAVAPTSHPAEARQRRLGLIAMIALGVIGGCLVLQQHLSDRADDMTSLRTEGPFRATVAVDGTFQLGAAVQALQRGEAFGWASSFCAAPQTGLLMQVRMVRLIDNRVLLYRERTLAADARGCSSAAWDIVLPPDAPPGRYQLQRFLLLTPADAPARTHTLPPLAIDVIP